MFGYLFSLMVLCSAGFGLFYGVSYAAGGSAILEVYLLLAWWGVLRTFVWF